jgi:hypothetical protein
MKRHAPTIFFVALAVLAWLLISHLQPTDPGAQKPSQLAAIENKGVDLVTEMNKLIIAVASLVLAGIGKLVTSERKDGKRAINLVAWPVRMLLGTTVVLAVATLYFSYIIYDKLVEMLAGGFLNLNSNLILSPREWQVDCLLAALFTLGLAVMVGLSEEA